MQKLMLMLAFDHSATIFDSLTFESVTCGTQERRRWIDPEALRNSLN